MKSSTSSTKWLKFKRIVYLYSVQCTYIYTYTYVCVVIHRQRTISYTNLFLLLSFLPTDTYIIQIQFSCTADSCLVVCTVMVSECLIFMACRQTRKMIEKHVVLLYSFLTKRFRRLNSHFFELLLFPFIHSGDYQITDNQMETLQMFVLLFGVGAGVAVAVRLCCLFHSFCCWHLCLFYMRLMKNSNAQKQGKH